VSRAESKQFGRDTLGGKGAFVPKYALEKVNRWRACQVDSSWRRPPPIEDSQDVVKTIMGREYHALSPSGLGVTPSGVGESCFSKITLKKDNWWGAGGGGSRRCMPSPVEDSRAHG